MSIAQNLKILNKPINEIAMLSQETIMAMAQAGQIPVAFVAPILAQKAETDQRAAEAAAMMAQEQQDQTAVGSGTVIEKIIAQNAMNEAQQSMPMMPAMPQMPMGLPEDTGIASLPVPDESMPSEFASGGIVAFDVGGDVRDEENSIYSGLNEDAMALASARERFLGPNQTVADLIAYNKEAEERAARRAKQQFNTRLIEAGLLGLGGDSPYFGVNMGRMAPAVRGMGEDVAKQEEATEARKKSELTAKGAERKEKEAAFSEALAGRLAREKLAPETIREARAIQDEARKAGRKVPTLREAIKSIERTTGTATLQSAMLNAQAKRATARTEALKNLSLDPTYSKARKKGDTDTVRRMEREARARVDAQYADFLPPGVDVDESAASASRKTPTGTVDKNNPLLR